MNTTEGAATKRPLIEIVPNFSEGRREDVIAVIVEALSVPGAQVVNRQWDPDHNRLDVSLVGPPEAVRASALAGAAKAAELIDMEQHEGSHPRMGAVDVIPFLPIRDVTMDDCVALAREVAQEIGERLGIPAYCYDQAALMPERKSLADVRKGEYEGLKADVAAGKRLPDFGPHELGKAGAVAVGARKPLVAFNVYLDGKDEPAAKDIARRVREATGGLKNVRAIGFFVPERDRITVSMNLVDTDATPIYRAFELVKSEASRWGLAVTGTEIVGLVPQAAVAETARFYLQLEGFDADAQILESAVQLAEAAGAAGAPAAAAGAAGTPPPAGGLGGRTISAFLEVLASDAPTPGGGTAAALTGACGAALVAMVGRLTFGKKGYEDVSPRMDEIVALADRGRADLLALAARDAEAFDAVMAAFRMPKEGEDQKAARSEAIQRAMLAAAEVPMRVARRGADLLELSVEVTERGNASAASDGVTAAHLLRAGVEGALANVEINLSSVRDREVVVRMRAQVQQLRGQATRSLQAAGAAFRRRLAG